LLSKTITEYVPGHNEVIELVLALVLHVYVYGKVPPVGDNEILPLHIPLHCGFTILGLSERLAGSVNVTD
jgi:hypothetical protein